MNVMREFPIVSVTVSASIQMGLMNVYVRRDMPEFSAPVSILEI